MLRGNIDGKSLVVGIVILFVATNVIPIVDANFMKMPEGKKVTLNFVNSEKKIKITIHYYNNGETKQIDEIMLPKSNALELKNRLKAIPETNESFIDIWERQIDTLKKAEVLSQSVTLSNFFDGNCVAPIKFIENSDLGWHSYYGDSVIMFGGYGFVVPLGTHKKPNFLPTGWDLALGILGLFSFYARSTEAFSGNNNGSAFIGVSLCGGIHWFTGIIIEINPGSFAPFKVGIGHARASWWFGKATDL
ncbi:MAG: hypothetical protein KAW47_01530 [Thermoplasmatales archaeon]|nr:hypothetical protein [Thermoplasmatales archaeon]